jgi:hypothetical protein
MEITGVIEKVLKLELELLRTTKSGKSKTL